MPFISPPSSSNNSLGKSLYRRILKELRATRNFDHHLRDIRFLLWVPGTKGKRQYDELKRLAVMSSSLHATRKSNGSSSEEPIDNSSSSTAGEPKIPKRKAVNLSPSIADQIRAVARGLFRKEKERMEQFTKLMTNQQQQQPNSSSILSTAAVTTTQKPLTPVEISLAKAKAIQEGTKRAFWAIKRLQDVRAGLVPNASMWLVSVSSGGSGTGLSSAYQHYLSPAPTAAVAAARANLLLISAAVAGSSNSNTKDSKSSSTKSSAKNSASSSSSSSGNLITSFDPFLIPRDAQLRTGNFPFVYEFLGIDQENSNEDGGNNRNNKKMKNSGALGKSSKKRKENNNSTVTSSTATATTPVDPLEEHLEGLETFGKIKNKVLKLDLVSRCASKDGPSARYHLSFRLENISEFAVDVKLAHLFAINYESPPVLHEMVCLLPLLGNSILSPYSASAFENSNNNQTTTSTATAVDDEEDSDENEENEEGRESDEGKNELNTENLKSVPRKRESKKKKQEEENEEEKVQQQEQEKTSSPTEEFISEAPHHQFTRKIRINSDASNHNSSAILSTNPSATTASLPFINHSKSTTPDFTAKAKSPDHCAVYDVSVPFQGDCVLRGFVLYRTISNTFPSAEESVEEEQNNNSNEPKEKEKEKQQQSPSGVRSRLKVLHLPVIKLVSSSD
jgi:hypothetical protein